MKTFIDKNKDKLFVFPVLLAQTGTEFVNLDNVGGIGGELKTLTIPGLISAAITFLFIITAVVFFFILVIGGIRWILSGGDKANTEAARSQITAGLIGLVIVFSAFAIVKLIEAFFGVAITSSITVPTANP